MTNKTTNTPPFKVKCTDIESQYLTVGKEYDVVGIDDSFYKVKNYSGITRWYYDSRFEIVETPPKDKKEFSVGDKVVVNKISDDFVSSTDKNVKVGDIATVTMIEGSSKYDVRLSNPNWEHGWWFSKTDISLVHDNILDNDKIGVVQMTKSMNKSTGKFLKCIRERPYFTEGKLYEIFKDSFGDWYIEDDEGDNWFSFLNGEKEISYTGEACFVFTDTDNTPIENQQNEIVVGSKVWVVDSGNVTVDTITNINNESVYCYRTEKSSYDKNGCTVLNNYKSARIFLINETNQKALQVVYPQLTFEIPKEQTLAEKRYDVIKKLYDSGKVVVIKYGDKEGGLGSVGVLTALRPLDYEFPYVTFNGWRYACAIDLDGNEITNV